MIFDGNNLAVHIDDSFIHASDLKSWNPVVFNNCGFHGDTKVHNNTSSEHEVMYLDFHETILEFYNCNFTGITAPKYSRSIIYCKSSNITMMNATVRGNIGPFMLIEGNSYVEITHSEFRNNSGPELLQIQFYSQLTFKDSHLSNNLYEKGGIYLYKSSGHVINSTFTENQGVNYGSVTIEISHLTTSGCQFLRNTAKAKGAAVHIKGGSQYNDHSSLFADNTAGEGGKFLLSTVTIHQLYFFKLLIMKFDNKRSKALFIFSRAVVNS